MSGTTIGAKFDQVDQESLQQFAKENDLNQSEALRKATQRGLKELGYQDGAPRDAYLENVADEITRLFAYAAATLIAVQYSTELYFDHYISYLLFFALAFQAVVRLKPRLMEAISQ